MAYATAADVTQALGLPADPPDDLTGRIDDSLAAAIDRVNEYCDRTFTTAAAAIREFPIPREVSFGGDYRFGYRYQGRRSIIGYPIDIDDYVGTIAHIAITRHDNTTNITERTWESHPVRPARGRPHSAFFFTREPINMPIIQPGDRFSIAASFGWPAVPAAVKTATILLASRHFRRQDAPLGIAGTGDFGVAYAARSDADAFQLLDPYRRVRIH